MMVLSSTLPAQGLCVDLGDPAGDFVPRGYCARVTPGDIGAAVNIHLEEIPFTVLEDPDGRLDIIVPLDPSITASQESPITYSTSLSWPSTPVSRDSIRVRELAVNFLPDPSAPRFAPLTNLPAGEVPPASFAWVEAPNDATQVIGWTVEQQITEVPSEIGGTISHYHMTTWDLPVGTPVTFSKRVTGGIVTDAMVPEPSTFVALAVGTTCALGACRRRRPNQISHSTEQ